MSETEKKSILSLPVAIVVAAFLIGGAILIAGDGSVRAENFKESAFRAVPAADLPGVRLVDDSDYIFGSSEARVTLIEYSDFECPFCARIHPSLQKIVAEYPEVNWVYRHFPIASHRNALFASIAAECAGSVGGKEAFWYFTDNLLANQTRISEEYIAELVADLSLDSAEFAACQLDPNIEDKVLTQLEEITSIGANSTPTVIVVTASGDYLPFPGALPYEKIEEIVQFALEN